MASTGIIRSSMKPPNPPDIDLYTLIAENFKKCPKRQALVDVQTNKSYTFEDLERMSNAIAQHLLSLGFSKTSTLLIYSSNSLEYGIMAVAALRLGRPFACVNSMSTSKDLIRLLGLCDADFVFASNDIVGTAIRAAKGTNVKAIFSAAPHPGCISFQSLTTPNSSLPKLPSVSSLKVDIHSVCCILFSSGTTGLPKAVMLSHHGLVCAVSTLGSPSMNIIRGNSLVFVPMSHIFGIGMTLFGMLLASTTLVMKSFDPILYLESIAKYRLQFIHVVPPIAVLLAKSPITEKYDLTSVEGVICGAAPLSATIEKEVIAKLKGKNCRILQLYGLTETTGGATGSFTDEDMRKANGIPPTPPGSCGLLLPLYEAKVVDLKTGESLGRNKDGELCFRGPQIMIGYQKNIEATKGCIDPDGWFHSGDIGHVDENGYFFIVDRLKELIKYKGFQVAPAELEELLLSHPSIADCGVVGLPDETSGELPHAWVVPKPESNVTEQQIVQFVEKNVAPYKKLRGGVRFVSQIPKSPSGKILRREIKDAIKSKMSKL